MCVCGCVGVLCCGCMRRLSKTCYNYLSRSTYLCNHSLFRVCNTRNETVRKCTRSFTQTHAHTHVLSHTSARIHTQRPRKNANTKCTTRTHARPTNHTQTNKNKHVQIALSHRWRLTANQARLAILRTFLPRACAVEALCARQTRLQ